MREIESVVKEVTTCEYVAIAKTSTVDLGTGHARMHGGICRQNLFYKVLGEKTGLDIEDEGALLDCMMRFAEMKKKYDKIKDAYDEVQNTGYGIVMPAHRGASLWRNRRSSSKAANMASA